ncbi:hypothetical protein WH52_08140 [Tenacibaculum holothuriorum]|uniref:Uncharacterized protein n=2 Tax=Tenacibaculum holothuriorum TaxID=1635173 RepID=A0A1Y2PBY8_9FLAO|nr:hypothetical protein WH52_08140 [Tenacibaculum holothuriorum]
MNADFIEAPEELEKITSRVDNNTYQKIHSEFDVDNDYVSIQKIKVTLNGLNISEAEIEVLFEEIKELFLADGKYEVLERNLMLGLKKVLK